MSDWPVVRLGEVVTIRPAKKEAKARAKEEDLVTFLPMAELPVRGGHVAGTEERILRSVYGSYTYFADGDVLLAKITPCFENGKLGIARGLKNGIGFGSSEFMVIRPDPTLSAEFLYFFLAQDNVVEDGIPAMTGAVGHKRIPQEYIEQIEIPLPPLDEQKRIVAKLDEASATKSHLRECVDLQSKDLELLRIGFLESVFDPTRAAAPWLGMEPAQPHFAPAVHEGACNVGGRPETDRILERRLSLGVGQQRSPARPGWQWKKLTEIAQLESGHTPSRSRDEYWGGSIPWLNIPTARDSHGDVVWATEQNITEAGLANSAARVLPAGTVCLSRTASLGYVTILGVPMATDQNFVNWVCSQHILPEFLRYLLLAENRNFRDLSTGSVHQSVYVPDVKAFYVCLPTVEEQKRVISYLDHAMNEIRHLKDNKYRNEILLKDWYTSFVSKNLMAAA